MPEVAGDAALLVDPSQPQQIAEAMFLIENDVQLREQLISKGLERVKNFSWDTTSQILWNSIEKLHQQVSKAPERP
jgi:glycosyltransferase involved in cell wall biosynthesis